MSAKLWHILFVLCNISEISNFLPFLLLAPTLLHLNNELAGKRITLLPLCCSLQFVEMQHRRLTVVIAFELKHGVISSYLASLAENVPHILLLALGFLFL